MYGVLGTPYAVGVVVAEGRPARELTEAMNIQVRGQVVVLSVLTAILLVVVVVQLPNSAIGRVNAVSTLLVALATLSLVGVGAIALWREDKRDKERARVADARISGIAFPLRRQIQSWIEERTWPTCDLGRQELAKRVTGHLDVAEKRMERLLGEAADSSEDYSQTVRRAAVAFYSATDVINRTANARYWVSQRDNYGGVMQIQFSRNDISEMFDRAEDVLRACSAELQTLIDEELRSPDTRLLGVVQVGPVVTAQTD